MHRITMYCDIIISWPVYREVITNTQHLCLRLNWTRTGLNNLYMIDSPCGIFDTELDQHKFLEESQDEMAWILLTAC